MSVLQNVRKPTHPLMSRRRLVSDKQHNRVQQFMYISRMNTYPEDWPQFYTATINNWQHLLEDELNALLIVVGTIGIKIYLRKNNFCQCYQNTNESCLNSPANL